ncbi:hypothetical protein M0R45_013451 [Rubus argutus]|uniref:Mitochondrial fission 1 protein A n=1 Tax=Rubus argutus TaxID=59490 RepID=A0AAW1XJ82_RUBAR
MMNKFFKWVGSLFGREDQIPWCDREIILGCEREVAEDMDKGESREEHKSESIMRLSWALVHSRQPEDVERGIAMLLQAALLANERCLRMEPEWIQALTLKKTVEDQIVKDGFIGIGITASAVIAGGIVCALVRRQLDHR